MNTQENLSAYRKSLQKIDDLIKTAALFGGSVAIGDEIVTTAQLKEIRSEVKSDIAVELSNGDILKLIK